MNMILDIVHSKALLTILSNTAQACYTITELFS